jgi:hypothetical protein
MALTEKQIHEIKQAGEAFLEKRRPPVEIRHKLDLAYRIEGQSVFVHEIRPKWSNPSEIIKPNIAKTTFIQTQNHWKVYWMRADLKWHSFTPKTSVKSIQQFFNLVDKDAYGCFFG